VACAGPHARYLETITVSWGDNEHGQGPGGRCIREGITQVQETFEGDSRFMPFLAAARREGFGCAIILPVFVDGTIDGALAVYATEPGSFDPLAQTLLEDLARDIGYGLERLRDGARLSQALRSSIFLLAAAVEARDPYTAGHQAQVGALSGAIARRLRLPDDVAEGVQLGASIHDLGKITISRATLVKPDKLTDEEWGELRKHPGTGYEIAGRFDWPWPIAEMLYQHHERLDGSGYPRGLAGDEIIVEARIIAVADTFEAIGHDRPYRAAPGFEVARQVLADGRGTLFDADVVDALTGVLDDGFHFPDNSI
jgi:HD-GYP domain-containing protein (c-di-GMP phosphodiesterase class II)